MINKDVVIKTRPLSVNKCRQGRRYKTKDYLEYEKFIIDKLPNIFIPSWPIRIDYEFWFSNPRADIDNIIKPLQDILQKRYWFDDNRVYEITIKKFIVAKWFEFIKFNLDKILTRKSKKDLK